MIQDKDVPVYCCGKMQELIPGSTKASGENGLTFLGIPDGHKFSSFVRGLYNAAGPRLSIDRGVQQGIFANTKSHCPAICIRTWW